VFKKILSAAGLTLLVYGTMKSNEARRKRIAWIDDRVNTFDKIEAYLDEIQNDESLDPDEVSRIFDEQMEFMDIIHNLDVV
jgi:hypothetical protein